MKTPPPPPNEAQRLATLRALGLLDTPSEERFDRITRLAQHMFEVPIVLISLVDEDRQWFKSRQGLGAEETPRSISFCGHAILEEGLLVVPDAQEDERFADNPLVTAEPNIRFYAGCPIEAGDGSRLGTLCLIDRQPRELSAAQRVVLQDLGELIEREIATMQLATQDELTGLANRRGFTIAANQALAICRRMDRPATLVYIDMDGFKAINDVHGHAAGDRGLREFARHLTEVFRTSDVVARLGGDEFAALLTGSENADRALLRLRDHVQAANAASNEPFQLAYTSGVARFAPTRHLTLHDLVSDADRAMYHHKNK
jgi:diguanylate cyclase (GGDEF)-like protein